MKKTISTELTSANIVRVTALLANSPGELESLSAGLSSQQLRQPLRVGERSFTQDQAHLLNSETRSSEAIYLALLADEPLFVNVDPERLPFDIILPRTSFPRRSARDAFHASGAP